MEMVQLILFFHIMQIDLLLRQYPIIIIDEDHERSFSTDILIEMLSRVVWLRQVRRLLLEKLISQKNFITL